MYICTLWRKIIQIFLIDKYLIPLISNYLLECWLVCFSFITPRGHWDTIECSTVCLGQVLSWLSFLQAEAGIEFTSCPRRLHSQPNGGTEPQTHDVQSQSPTCYPVGHHTPSLLVMTSNTISDSVSKIDLPYLLPWYLGSLASCQP